jgi:hypothetical protein
LRIARLVARHAVILLLVFLALSPATVLAFNPPDPNSPGHHYGEYLHNWHLQTSQPAPAPAPGGGNNNSGGIQNAFGVLKSGSAGPSPEALPAFHFQHIGMVVPQLTAASNAELDAWWVVVLLAAFIAANVVLAVLYVSRGGNYVLRLVLRQLPISA